MAPLLSPIVVGVKLDLEAWAESSWCIQELGAHFPHMRLRSLLREGRQVKEHSQLQMWTVTP